MKHKILKIALFILITITMPVASFAWEVKPVPESESRNWLRYLLPLPHRISIHEKIIADKNEIKLLIPPGGGKIDKSVVDIIGKLIHPKKTKVRSANGYQIVIGIPDARGTIENIPIRRFKEMKDVPNRDQAYVIQPDGHDKLVLAALNQKGIWYAAVTLSQLLQPFLSQDQVVIPLADVLDWPDLEERGLWNFSSPAEWIPWLASVKLNLGKMDSTEISEIRRGEPNHIKIDSNLMAKARTFGFNYLPFIIHYNFLKDYGLYRAYPELAGFGDGALSGRYFAHDSGDEHRVPCASNPLFARILSEWMTEIASQGAEEVSCWLSERPAQCGCTRCMAEGQFVWEARSTVSAWRETQKKFPGFRIRIFISTTTSERYFKVLAETPPEVKIERACASWIERVSREPRDLYRNPLLDSYATEGRWLASYDVPLGAYGRVDTPEYKVPCSSAHRIRNYVEQLIHRGWKGACGMMAWDNNQRPGPAEIGRLTYDFNIQALAEWAWNLNGRSEKEFAVAWAARQGYAEPKMVGEWAVMMGPIEFDVYDSEFPIFYSMGKAAQLINERRRPILGEGLFRYYSDPADFDRKIGICDQALPIALKFKNPFLANETMVVRSYVKLAKAIYWIAETLATEDLASAIVQQRLPELIEGLRQAGAENVSSLRNWRRTLGPEPWHYRFYNAVKGTETTVSKIEQIVANKYLF
jgi:hypothetical protein